MIYWHSPKVVAQNFLNWYVELLLKAPFLFLAASFLSSLVLTLIGLYFHIGDFSTDPRKGFEARGTPLSEKRLALEALAAITKPVSELLQPSVNSSDIREKRDTKEKDISFNSTPTTVPIDGQSTTVFTIDYEDYGVDNKPLGVEDVTRGCEQYFAMGKFIPYESLEFLSKAIFEVGSFDELFTLKVMQRLCRLDELIATLPSVKNFITPLPFSFNLPSYVMCVDSRQRNCDDLTQSSVLKMLMRGTQQQRNQGKKKKELCKRHNYHIDIFREQVDFCVKNPQSLACLTEIAQQLQNYILQKVPKDRSNKNATIPQGKFYVGAILRVQLASYNTFESQQFYHNLLDMLGEEYAADTDVALVGLEINSRDMFFEDLVYADTHKAGIAVAVVALVIWCYCSSLIFTLVVMIGMFLSVGVAFFFYSTVFGITFFPFVNLLVIVVAIAIGADDAFLLAFQYDQAKKEIENYLAKTLSIGHNHSLPDCSCRESRCYYTFGSAKLNRVDKSTDYNALAMRSALRHAAGAMFITSATTAVAFLTNFFSNILVLRCFGAFSCLTITVNYLFVVSGLPAALLFLDKHDYCLSHYFPECNFSSLMKPLANFYIYKSPSLLNTYKHYLTFVAFLLTAFFFFSILCKPGVRLPEHNPLQLLRSSHPFEWFAENEKAYFNFSDHRDHQLNFYVLWGIHRADDASRIVADKPVTPNLDNRFPLHTWSDFKNMESSINTVLFSSAVRTQLRNTTKPWFCQFLSWAQSLESNDLCLIDEATETYSSGCFQKFINTSKKLSKFPNDFTKLFEDSPIFHPTTNELIGYFVVAPSNYKLSLLYAEVEPLMKDITLLESQLKNQSEGNSAYVSLLFDLLQALLQGTLISITSSLLICAAVVLVMTRSLILSLAAIINISLIILAVTSFILWLGWTINIVESTILVITIGLSFDYTLHVAVAFKYAPDVVNTQRLVHANKAVTVPIFLAMTTNLGAGVVLLGSSTQPFYEVGVFLVVLATVSYVMTIIMFPSILFTFAQIMKKQT